jgi:hypothetical protein
LLSPESSDDDEGEGKAKFSDDDEDKGSGKAAQGSTERKARQSRNPRIDFAKLPFLDNNGLSYLPKMQYFDVDDECPLEPANNLELHQALMVIIHLMDGSFKCLAIPLDAVFEDEHE